MTTKFNFALLLILSSIISFTQPSKEMLKSIPKESYCVISLNTSNIVEKLDFNRIKALPVIKTAFEELKKGARKDSVTLKKFYEDPNSLGVSLEPSITAFFHFTESEYEDPIGFVGMMIPLSNGIKFDILLKNVLQGKYDEVKDGKNYKYIPMHNTVVAWNKNFLTLYVSFSYKGKHLLDEHLTNIYKPDAKKSLVANNSEYKTFVKRKNDFSVWFDIIKAEKLLKEQTPMFADNKMFSLQTTSMEFELNFEDGKVAFATKQHHDDEMQELINRSYSQRVDPEMLKYVSTDELLGFTGVSIDLSVIKEMYEDKYHNLYDSIYNGASRQLIQNFVDKDSTLKAWRKSLYEKEEAAEAAEEAPVEEEDIELTAEEGNSESENIYSYHQRDSIWDLIYAREDSLEEFYYDGRDSIMNTVLAKYDLKKEDLWSLFTGDVLFASNGTFEVVDTFYTYEYVENQDGEWAYDEVQKTRTFPAPLFKLLIGVNYGSSVKKALDDIIGMMERDLTGFEVERKDGYFIIDAKYTKLYLSVFNDKYILLTNNKPFFEEIGTKGYKNNLANSKEFDYLTKNGSAFFYANINAILKKTEKGDPQDIAMFNILENTFVSFDAGTQPDDRGGYSGFSNVNMTKQDDNSIHILFDLSNEIYLYYKSFK